MTNVEKLELEEKQRIRMLSNKKLLEETLELAGGDSYDGEFTTEGRLAYYALRDELDLRLKDWLKDEQSGQFITVINTMKNKRLTKEN